MEKSRISRLLIDKKSKSRLTFYRVVINRLHRVNRYLQSCPLLIALEPRPNNPHRFSHTLSKLSARNRSFVGASRSGRNFPISFIKAGQCRQFDPTSRIFAAILHQMNLMRLYIFRYIRPFRAIFCSWALNHIRPASKNLRT